MSTQIETESPVGVDRGVVGLSSELVSGELIVSPARGRLRVAAGKAVAHTRPGPGMVQSTTHGVAARVKAAGSQTRDLVEPCLVGTVTSAGRGAATASAHVNVAVTHRTRSRQDRARFRRAGGRVPRRAWLLWVLLGPVGAHRFYLRSWVSGVLRGLTSLSCWVVSVLTITLVLPGLMTQLLPDALNSGISTFVVAPWAPQLALAAMVEALRSGVTLVLAVIVAALVLLMLPTLLWLLDAMWIGRNLRRRNKIGRAHV